jgi:drug/metabolite transporter (DMT)-like permease
VLATVFVQLMAAAALGFAAARGLFSPMTLALVLLALALNGFRFLAWGYLHRRFPLSHVYPLTALFFPCVLILATLRGESITPLQIAGTLLITAGSFLMATASRDEAGNDSLPPLAS